MTEKLPGKLIVVDGLDGIGKSEVLDAILKYLSQKKERDKKNIKKMLRLPAYWKHHHIHPQFKSSHREDGSLRFDYVASDLFDIIQSEEPTYVGKGMEIRYEIINTSSADYSPRDTADAYASDRHTLLTRVEIPARKLGKTIIKSRCFSASYAYQPLQIPKSHEKPADWEYIKKLPGNQLSMQYPPDLFIIATIKDSSIADLRRKNRQKQDNCIFELSEFQKKLKPRYESNELREIFESLGTRVEYIDLSGSIEETHQKSIDCVKKIWL